MSRGLSGTIVFLFTDIEGSTRRWERHRDEMRLDLAQHDEIVRGRIECNGGTVFKTVGDAFYAVFPRAPQAVLAALEAQRALQSARWRVPEGVAVRMALHAGEAEEREGDYFGSALNRVARLLSAGHGRQVLLSAAAAELAREALPPAASLQPLGAHRLKDLSQPQQVYQLLHPDLPSSFPALVTLDSRPNNLRPQPTSLIGRERELAAVLELMGREDARLVSLTGAGGTGKSRLALQLAADAVDSFDDGVYFVDLSSVREAEEVARVALRALGAGDALEGQQGAFERLAGFLGRKRMLLVLDNFEQVLPAAPRVVDLLGACPRLKLLVTTREPLHVRGEREYPVPPLDLPIRGAPEAVERLTHYEAVRLLIDRAVAVKPDFRVTNENAPAVAEICIRLDGLPLAIELAAARLKILSPQALLDRLVDRMKLLTGGARDLPTRQQTLRGTIDWSYQLLPDAEKALFRRLSVFAGGCTLESAEAVCRSAAGEIDTLDGLSSLVDKSQLSRTEVGGEVRFVMLETIRAFARELLDPGEAGEVRGRHAEHFTEIAEQAHEAQHRPDWRRWLERLDREHDNMREALAWLRAAGKAEGVRLAAALGWYWERRSCLAEGSEWLRAYLDLSSGSPPTPERADALYHLGNIASLLQPAFLENSEARACYRESLRLYRSLGDLRGTALSLAASANSEYESSAEERRSAFEEGVQTARSAGDPWALAFCLVQANQQPSLGGKDPAEQQAALEEAIGLARGTTDPWLICFALYGMGTFHRDQEKHEAAEPWLRESLGIAREIDDRSMILSALQWLIDGYVGRRMPEEARQLLPESVRLCRDLGATGRLAFLLGSMAGIAFMEGKHRKAARLIAAWGKITQPSRQLGAYAGFEEGLGLDQETLAADYAIGAGMALEQAVEYGTSLEGDPPAHH